MIATKVVMQQALAFVERVTSYKDGGPDRHDTLIALRESIAQSAHVSETDYGNIAQPEQIAPQPTTQAVQEPTEAMIRAGCLSQQATPEYDNYEDWANSYSGGTVECIRGFLRKDYLAMLAAIAQPEQIATAKAEPACSDHPDAPHGFDRNASHSADRYVCDCEGWAPNDNAPSNITHSEQATSESYDLIDRFLRNNLDDEDYAEFSAALDSIYLPEAVEQPTTVKAKPVAYREWVTKFGGSWEFYSADDMPAGNYAAHRTLDALFLHPAVQPEQRNLTE